MKRHIAIAATTAVFGTALAASGYGFASDRSEGELADFLNDHPDMINVVAELEANTGGVVEEAEFEDEHTEQLLVEFEVALADGTEQEWLYSVADGKWTLEEEDDRDGDCRKGRGDDDEQSASLDEVLLPERAANDLTL